MHETAWVRALVRTVTSTAAQQGARRVVGVTVRMGSLSGLSPAHAREHFVEAARGTIAEDASLTISEGHDEGLSGSDVMVESIEVEE